jgi:hypothetical protein
MKRGRPTRKKPDDEDQFKVGDQAGVDYCSLLLAHADFDVITFLLLPLPERFRQCSMNFGILTPNA